MNFQTHDHHNHHRLNLNPIICNVYSKGQINAMDFLLNRVSELREIFKVYFFNDMGIF